MQSTFNNCARVLARTLISRFRPLVELLLFFIRYVVVTTDAKQMAFTHAHCLKYKMVHCVSFHGCLFVLVFVSFFLDSKQICIFQFCNFMLSNPIIWRIIHEESGDTEFFYQSATRYLSSERSNFPHLASHVET